jgi:hypothetical protein
MVSDARVEQEVAVSSVASWDNFYVIIGGSAAGLTGLMFVVITLITGSRVRSGDGISAYSTPTVVHFAAALLIAAILSAPWTALAQIAVALGLVGLGGLGYVVVVVLRRLLRVGRTYQPVFEDWLAHVIIPVAAYITLLVAAILLQANTVLALFFVGGVTTLLIFDGIHNAWDIVTYLALDLLPSQQDDAKRDDTQG